MLCNVRNVVKVGFAGSRLLFGPRRVDAATAQRWEDELLALLIERLRALPQRLGLAPHEQVCGVSQVAIGADTLFTRACQALGLPQHVLLPQPSDAFLAAGDPGEPDFTAEEQAAARALLDSEHVIDVRVASRSGDRIAQFEDTNREILCESDAVVCLLREGALARPGGTQDLIARARAAGKPVLLLEAALRDGKPWLSDWTQLQQDSR